jgi:ubiquitin carboxyl-terminal hydrolase 7
LYRYNELNRVLCEKLEEKMKATSVEGTIQKLFEGHTVNFINCVDVEYKSTRKEAYLDLQLDVKGCKVRLYSCCMQSTHSA